ncbi:hypothetical protein FOQG_11972 [Fusarium oxysporum f. sp. raphani 54005]|uniref:Uncharacterized protein n=2 Tax=Fusarium oxysporum TaxID=5507 RepID=X0CMQ0_FUSOX|nr:hypothetical protein FOQG_11972 [Fusarium oxysporum f. sp. raphani 54005]EXL71600.1 hypothetical protein FOPG_12653 [Fusarium oxysporum f. sp. conglutinans race 2 54008]
MQIGTNLDPILSLFSDHFNQRFHPALDQTQAPFLVQQ